MKGQGHRKNDEEMDFQANIQRVKEIEIPLFRLEQKVQKIESALLLKFDNDKLAEAISKRIDENPHLLIPSISKQLFQIKSIKDKQDILNQKITLNNFDGTISPDDLKQLKF